MHFVQLTNGEIKRVGGGRKGEMKEKSLPLFFLSGFFLSELQ